MTLYISLHLEVMYGRPGGWFHELLMVEVKLSFKGLNIVFWDAELTRSITLTISQFWQLYHFATISGYLNSAKIQDYFVFFMSGFTIGGVQCFGSVLKVQR